MCDVNMIILAVCCVLNIYRDSTPTTRLKRAYGESISGSRLSSIYPPKLRVGYVRARDVNFPSCVPGRRQGADHLSVV